MTSTAVAASVVLLAIVAGQATPRDTGANAPAGTAVVRGRVVAAESGRPLSLVTITASAPELREPRSISTNSQGVYELRNLPPGHYVVSAAKSGYLKLQFGQRRAGELGKTIDVGTADVGSVDFVLPRSSVISGRITDEEGEPVSGASVFAMQPRYFGGRRAVVPIATNVSTNEDGAYRVLGLSPGTYYVMSSTWTTWTVNEAGTTATQGYAPTYFPGVADLSAARPVTVGVGEEAKNTDFTLAPGRAATVSGTVIDSSGRPVANQMVAFLFSIAGPGGGMGGVRYRATTDRDGSFSVAGVMPGELTIAVNSAAPDASFEGVLMPIVVDGSDLHVSLTTSSGAAITGRVMADRSASLKEAGNVLVFAIPTTGFDMIVGPADPRSNPRNGRVADDGGFEIRGLSGPARLEVGNLRDGWIQTAVLVDGRNAGGKPIDFSATRTVANVQIVLSNRANSVKGQVTGPDGAAATDQTVIVFADDPDRWFDRSRYVRAARMDQNGRFEMKNLPPAEYLAAAVEYATDTMWTDPAYLDSLRAQCVRFTLDDGERKSIALKVAVR